MRTSKIFHNECMCFSVHSVAEDHGGLGMTFVVPWSGLKPLFLILLSIVAILYHKAEPYLGFRSSSAAVYTYNKQGTK
jgi:hypothetical protein